MKSVLSEENHMQNSSELEFWTCLQSSQLVPELLRTLASLFASLYSVCDKGKDKYMKFQLEWHRCCSIFILPSSKGLSDTGVDPRRYADLANCSSDRLGSVKESLTSRQ